MKLAITDSAVTDLPTGGEWVFIQSAIGDIDVTFVRDSESRTITLGQGEMIKMNYNGLQFQARDGGNQEISFRIGWGEYTPNITAVTSTQIQSINEAIQVAGINAAVSVSSIEQPVSVEGGVEVSGTVAAEIQNDVTIADLSNVVTTDYTITEIGSITIPARAGRKRIEIQGYSESENTILCRVSDTTKTEISGQYLPIGGGLLSSVEHKHAAALKVWSPTAEEISLTVLEEF